MEKVQDFWTGVKSDLSNQHKRAIPKVDFAFSAATSKNNEGVHSGVNANAESQKDIPHNIYGGDMEEWEEAQSEFGKLKEEVGSEIGLRTGFYGLRSKLGDWETDKERNARRMEDKQRNIDRNYLNYRRGRSS